MQTARTVRASSFSASLEMVREGRFDIRQDRPFAPLWVRRRVSAAEQPADGLF
jgi:segregation and condensation protein A